MKLDKALELFLSEYPNHNTVRAYRGVLEPMVMSIGAGRAVTRITTGDLLEYAADNIRTPDHAQATIYKQIKTLKTFFNWLVRIGELDKSPAAGVRQIRRKRDVNREKAMRDEEFEKLVSYYQWKPQQLAIVLFLGDTGCRAGGLASVRISALDIPNLTATVTEKGDKTRPVWFGERTAQALREWLIQRGLQNHDFVFCHRHGPYKPAAISQIVRRALNATGGRSLGAHSTRHRKAFQMADSRIAPSVAATALGHENVNTTLNSYYPADYDRAREVIRELAEPAPNRILKINNT